MLSVKIGMKHTRTQNNKKVETTNHTNSTNKGKKDYILKKLLLIHSCNLCNLLLKNRLWGGYKKRN